MLILLHRFSEKIPIAAIRKFLAAAYRLQLAPAALSIIPSSPSPQLREFQVLEAGRGPWTPLMVLVGAGHRHRVILKRAISD